ncbi:MAG: S8 family peptidase, partial [Bacteroidia bacterium]
MVFVRFFSLVCLGFLYIGFAKNASAQSPVKQYTVYLTDKSGNSYSLSRPLEFLSQRAMDRRSRQGIALEETDLPVSPKYIAALQKDGYQVMFTSAWQNTITVQTTDSLFEQKAQKYPFVKNTKRIFKKSQLDVKNLQLVQLDQAQSYFQTQYGKSYRQIEIHNGDELHNLGNQGQGMQIAVIDAGFWRVDTLLAFQKLRLRHGILATYDFVTGNDSVYEDATHGMYVLSAIAGQVDNQLIGTAPEANYYLLRTENGGSEYLAEEFAWIAAMEWADSAGADVINSSLGYSLFDDHAMNHTYADMNGETTPISKAASMVASKGMILVSSAGNSGAQPWRYITAPADAKDILTVAAVDSGGRVARFSSRGPSSDDRIKPDVAAIGVQTVVASGVDGQTIGSNGTSTAAPVITGLVACLWQEFPMRTSYEVMDAVRKSSYLYSNPNDSLGYGIPNFALARTIL